MEKYCPQAIEKKWQQHWDDCKTNQINIDQINQNIMYLKCFLPSGNLHMGHVRNYSIGDVIARYKTMNGFNVLHPMGFNAFGMPAENAAIKHGVSPSDWTEDNMANMVRQQKEMGLSYDWDRKVATCHEDYYKWTQWFFELFYKQGLAYKKKASANWCETCHTVLANEQVIDGKCWRCDNTVVKKDLEQWFFKITDYADILLKDLDKLEGWPNRVKTMQVIGLVVVKVLNLVLMYLILTKKFLYIQLVLIQYLAFLMLYLQLNIHLSKNSSKVNQMNKKF